MAQDLLRQIERAAVLALKSSGSLTALVPVDQIDPISEAPAFPFIRLDATQVIPRGRHCSARSEASFILNAFAKPRRNTEGEMVETARDFAGRIGSETVEALHQHAFNVNGRRYKFTVISSQLAQDGAERDCFQSTLNVACTAFVG